MRAVAIIDIDALIQACLCGAVCFYVLMRVGLWFVFPDDRRR